MISPNRIDQMFADVAPALALRAALELDLFTLLAREPATAETLGMSLSVDPARLSRLLFALASIGLIEAKDDVFRNGEEAATYLDSRKPTFRGGGHALWRELWEADLKTAESLRTGNPAALHEFSGDNAEATHAFIAKMAPVALKFGRELGRILDLSHVQSVIDIGGGPGTLLVGLREIWPQVAATLFELPSTAVAARSILAEHGASYIEVEEGDITVAPSTRRHDLAILKALVQVLPADQARLALRNAARSLNPGGMIAIAGWGVVDDDRMGPREGVFLNITFLNLYRSGEAYTEGQYRGWLTEAGFDQITRSKMDDGTALFTARLSQDFTPEL